MTTGADLDEDKLAEAEKKANEILERAKNGEDFDALIKEYNEDPGMESNQDGYFFTDGEMVSATAISSHEAAVLQNHRVRRELWHSGRGRLENDGIPQADDSGL